jgi:sugar phosphate isomerase/epimerase
MKLSFSTLGCPDWSFDRILEKGPEYGFDGVAFRALGGEPDLTRAPEFAGAERARTRKRLAAAGLRTNLLATSARMLIADPAALEASQLQAEAHIDLAADLECPFIRVFGGQIAAGVSHAVTIHRAAERLRRLGDHAGKRGVTVLLETHDDFLNPDFVRRVMEATVHPSVGTLWDVGEQFRIFGVPSDQVWEALRPWVRACDIKDSVEDFSAPAGYRFVDTGTGELPLCETIDILSRDGFDGWITFEWEKRWNPDIAEPEHAFPTFVAAMRRELARHS